jgi:Core-2/I-Branching enzyme
MRQRSAQEVPTCGRYVTAILLRNRILRRLTAASILMIGFYLISKVEIFLLLLTTVRTVSLKGPFSAIAASASSASGSQKMIVRPSPVAFPTADERCSSEYLGLPPAIVARCKSNISLDWAAELACEKLTCSGLINGHPFRKRDAWVYKAAIDFFPDQSELDEKQEMHGNQTAKGQQSDVNIKRLTSTPEACVEFRRSRGFVDRVDAEAADFPIAYNVLLHADAEQAARLMRAIYRPNNIYCIHVDRKSPEHFQSAMRSFASCFDNVKLATNPITVVYEGYSRLQADINCMKDNVNSNVRWKYLLNTAGTMFCSSTRKWLWCNLRIAVAVSCCLTAVSFNHV